MVTGKIHIKDLMQKSWNVDLCLSVVSGSGGLNREIKHPDVNRPGLSLAGFYEHFAADRIQIFGRGESTFLSNLGEVELFSRMDEFFHYGVFCCIFTHGIAPPKTFIKLAADYGVPILVTELPTTKFISELNYIIVEAQMEKKSIYGTLVDVYGIGVLIIGKSGVGKSEAALELIERGHRLIGDDIVIINSRDDYMLMGEGSKLIRHHMEIRGLGVLNVRDLFGISSVRNRKRIELVAELETWDEEKEYERFGLTDNFYTLLDIKLPYVLIPVRPGRNIPVLIESAALNQRLKKMGVYSARELDDRIIGWIQAEKANDRKESNSSG